MAFDNIPEININDFTYNLPEEKIAVFPLSERDQSKVLIWKDGHISETVFANIAEKIPEKSMLVFNNTRVIHARLHFRRETGALIEIFCLEPHKPADYQLSFQQTGEAEWKCLVGNARKWKQGSLQRQVTVGNHIVCLNAEMTGKAGNAFIIRFKWDQPVTFAEIIEAAGDIPIPPYLNREADESDNDRYQTLYAKIDGSVAAPTAGLHFTERVLEALLRRNISTEELTLHVGAGTFQPVKSEKVSEHEMHTETVVVTKHLIGKLMENKYHLIAIGTTSVRSLESLYWLGTKINRLHSDGILHVGQWEPYQAEPEISVSEALRNIFEYMDKMLLDQLTFITSIIIVPGYKFRLINGMLTNFHQPQSTLLLLIGAFLGNDWKKVYEYALKNNFRFLSYGDSNLYLKW